MAGTLLTQRAYARSSNSTRPTRRLWAAGNPRRPALLGACHSHQDLRTRSLAGTTVACRWNTSVVPAKPWVGVRWRDLCGAEERKTRGRARSALRCL